VLSMHDEKLYGERALRAGACGYIMKQEPPEHVIKGIRAVLRGEYFFSQDFQKGLLDKLARGDSTPAGEPGGGIRLLSNREIQVLELIGHGHSTRIIAEKMHLSPKTVEAHRVHIRNRLGLPDSTSLLHFAIHWVDSAGAKTLLDE